MAEVADLIRRLDTPTSAAVNEVRVIQLEHSLAQDVADDPAVGDRRGGRRPAPGAGGTPGVAPGGQLAAAAARTAADRQPSSGRPCSASSRSTPRGGGCSNSGILTDVRDHGRRAGQRPGRLRAGREHGADRGPDPAARPAAGRRGPDQGLHDRQRRRHEPGRHAADAVRRRRPPAAAAAIGGGSRPMMQTAAGSGESSLVPLRFAVDARTNSIIASGSAADLSVVEAILHAAGRQRRAAPQERRLPAEERAGRPTWPTPSTSSCSSERQVQQISAGPDQRLRADRARSGRGARAGQQQPDPQRHAAVLRRDQGRSSSSSTPGRRWS